MATPRRMRMDDGELSPHTERMAPRRDRRNPSTDQKKARNRQRRQASTEESTMTDQNLSGDFLRQHNWLMAEATADQRQTEAKMRAQAAVFYRRLPKIAKAHPEEIERQAIDRASLSSTQHAPFQREAKIAFLDAVAHHAKTDGIKVSFTTAAVKTAGESVEVVSVPSCDICASEGTDTPAYADARLMALGGSWANVCKPHFDAFGCSLGTGSGQAYVKKASRRTAARIDTLRDIVDSHRGGKAPQSDQVDGTPIDPQTANMLVTLHDGLNEDNKAKFEKIDLMKLVNFGWSKVTSSSAKTAADSEDFDRTMYEWGYEVGQRVRNGEEIPGGRAVTPGAEDSDMPFPRGVRDGKAGKPKATASRRQAAMMNWVEDAGNWYVNGGYKAKGIGFALEVGEEDYGSGTYWAEVMFRDVDNNGSAHIVHPNGALNSPEEAMQAAEDYVLGRSRLQWSEMGTPMPSPVTASRRTAQNKIQPDGSVISDCPHCDWTSGSQPDVAAAMAKAKEHRESEHYAKETSLKYAEAFVPTHMYEANPVRVVGGGGEGGQSVTIVHEDGLKESVPKEYLEPLSTSASRKHADVPNYVKDLDGDEAYEEGRSDGKDAERVSEPYADGFADEVDGRPSDAEYWRHHARLHVANGWKPTHLYGKEPVQLLAKGGASVPAALVAFSNGITEWVPPGDLVPYGNATGTRRYTAGKDLGGLTARQLRSALFEVADQSMTVSDLRHALFGLEQDAPLTSETIKRL